MQTVSTSDTRPLPLSMQMRLLAPAVRNPDFATLNAAFANGICPSKGVNPNYDFWTDNGRTMIEIATAAYLIRQDADSSEATHLQVIPETESERTSPVMIGKWLQAQFDRFVNDQDGPFAGQSVFEALLQFLMNPPEDISEETSIYLGTLRVWAERYIKITSFIQSSMWYSALDALMSSKG